MKGITRGSIIGAVKGNTSSLHCSLHFCWQQGWLTRQWYYLEAQGDLGSGTIMGITAVMIWAIV